MCKVCKYYDCFQSQSSNSTWYCPSRCALYYVLCCKPSVARLIDFCEDTNFFFAMNFVYTLGARWKDSKTSMTSVCLGKGPRSHRADMPWNDGQSLHLLSSLWPPVRRVGIQSGEEKGEIQVTGLPCARGVGTLQSTFSGLWGAWHAGEWCLWGCREPDLKLKATIATFRSWTSVRCPSFQWKSRTCVMSGNFSLCLSSSAVK